jgi:hypothetical protein
MELQRKPLGHGTTATALPDSHASMDSAEPTHMQCYLPSGMSPHPKFACLHGDTRCSWFSLARSRLAPAVTLAPRLCNLRKIALFHGAVLTGKSCASPSGEQVFPASAAAAARMHSNTGRGRTHESKTVASLIERFRHGQPTSTHERFEPASHLYHVVESLLAMLAETSVSSAGAKSRWSSGGSGLVTMLCLMTMRRQMLTMSSLQRPSCMARKGLVVRSKRRMQPNKQPLHQSVQAKRT